MEDSILITIVIISDREKLEAQKIETLKKDKKERLKQIEEQTARLKKMEAELKSLQAETEEKRSEVSESEEQVVAAKKEVQATDRELTSLEKKARNFEQLELRRAQKRHSLLHECKISGIELPLLAGNLEEVMVEEEPEEGDSETQGTQTTKASLVQADQIVVDYSHLKFPEKKLKEENELNKVVEKLKKEVADATANLSKIAAPNLRANERMEQVREKEAEASEECKMSSLKARKARQAFERVKNERFRLFTEFFEPVAQKIDEIYKV